MGNRTGLFCVLVAALESWSCSPPWTVRPIGEGEDRGSERHGQFDAGRYVDSIWSLKLVPAIVSSAVDVSQMLEGTIRPPAGSSVLSVKGRGRVLSVDTGSRAGTAALEMAPFDGRPGATLQIGPVIRGSALRDATSVVRFGDFVNQLQFADAGNALNERALEAVINPVRAQIQPGATVEFAGAGELATGAGGARIVRDIVPVRLSVEPPK